MKRSKNRKKKKTRPVKRESIATPGKKEKLSSQQIAYIVVIIGNLFSAVVIFLPYIYVNNVPVTSFSLMNLQIITIPCLSLSIFFAMLGLITGNNYAWGCVVGIFGGLAEHPAIYMNVGMKLPFSEGVSIGIGYIFLSIGALIAMFAVIAILFENSIEYKLYKRLTRSKK